MPNEPGKKPVVHTKKHIARLERERRQSRLILYIFIGIVAAVLGLLGYGYLDINYLQAKRPVAKVGGTEIISNQFESRVRLQRQQLLVRYSQMQYYAQFGLDVTAQIQQIEQSLGNNESLGESVLEQMIDEEIIRQEAVKRGIAVTDEELERAIQESFQFFPNGTPTPTVAPTLITFPTIPAQAFDIVTVTPTPSPLPTATGTPASSPTEGTDSAATGTPIPTATATLAPTQTPSPTDGPTSTPEPTATAYTLEGFKSEYEKTSENFLKFGFSMEEYRKLFELQLLRDKLFAEITADVLHVEDQAWARHILVADEEAAKAVLDRLAAGEDFGALAAELSQDPGSAPNGGDLGWFGKGAMVPPFEEAAFSLEPGQVSDPVKSDFGYHIIQVIARQERPLSEEQYSQATNKAFSDFLASAREEIGVEIFDFWKTRVPTDPNFETMATEAANSASTAQAETVNAIDTTATP